jgi:hypothetical protein
MANSEHLAKLKEGVAAWNDWRKATTEIVSDSGGAHLYPEDLGGADGGMAYCIGNLCQPRKLQ